MGWGAVATQLKEAKEKQEAFKRGDYNKSFVSFLSVKSGGEPAVISFIGDVSENGVEPWAAKVHTVPKPGTKQYSTFKCGGSQCPLCAGGDKAKFRVFFSVIDHRKRTFKFTKGDKAGQEGTSENQLCYYEASAANADMLFQKFSKAAKKTGMKSLNEAVVEISKYGEGTATTTSYDIEKRDNSYVIPPDVEPINFDELFAMSGSQEAPKYD